ncbi:MAG: hypothetical protein SFV22_09360 [Saprospiraceae bacterium]|nr:hypothetical protein [Saprospiraceae bacterium]
MQQNIKKALTCRQIQSYTLNAGLIPTYSPKMGDVGIFRVLQANSGYIMDVDKRASQLFDGDLVMLAFGNRYATNQYEGYVPESPVRQCHLLGRGGVAGIMTGKNATFKSVPAQLELVGYATGRNGAVLNTIRSRSLETFNPFNIRAKVILSIGTSMDSGKTTSAAWLCGGLRAAGKRVAYLKLTGTAFPKDAALNLDRGAHFAADFSHYGFPSTYLLDKATLLNLYQSLVNLACDEGRAEYIVMEIADGLLQRETAMLLEDARFRSTLHATLFSAGDSLGVLSGLQLLEQWEIRPFAVSGLFTASELLIREVADRIRIPVLRLNDLLAETATDAVIHEEEELHSEAGIWSDEQYLIRA